MADVEINAITFHVSDMARSLSFYTALGFDVAYGGPDEPFTSLRMGAAQGKTPTSDRWAHNHVNLQLVEGFVQAGGAWGRVVFHVADPDAIHAICCAAGFPPDMAPSDAPWGERYFHVKDPDGHELSFARPL